MDITYLGNSVFMLKLLIDDDRYTVKSIVSQSRLVSLEFKELALSNKIPIYLANSRFEVSSFSKRVEEICLGYTLEVFLEDSFIDEHTVYNIHPGNLRNNKCIHPLARAIISCVDETMLTVYKVGGWIEKGALINEIVIPIDDNDCVSTLRKKIEVYVPGALDEIYFYHLNPSKKRYIISTPRPKVQEKDYTIFAEKDTIKSMRRKINSQRDYLGAVYYHKGQKVYITDMEEYQNRVILQCLDGDRFVVTPKYE